MIRLTIILIVAVLAIGAGSGQAAAAQNIVKCQVDVSCYGTPGPDLIVGTGQADKIYGRDGNDEVYGNGGKDEIHGGGNADHIYPGPGSPNQVWGNSGDDVINGIDDTNGGCPLLWVDGGPGEDTAWSYGFTGRADVEHWGVFLCP